MGAGSSQAACKNDQQVRTPLGSRRHQAAKLGEEAPLVAAGRIGHAGQDAVKTPVRQHRHGREDVPAVHDRRSNAPSRGGSHVDQRLEGAVRGRDNRQLRWRLRCAGKTHKLACGTGTRKGQGVRDTRVNGGQSAAQTLGECLVRDRCWRRGGAQEAPAPTDMTD
jgi:hypothetical protein